MHLREALLDIAEIRSQIARSEQCRALRSASVGISGVLAFVAAVCQTVWISNPQQHIEEYLGLWTATALLGFAIPAGRLLLRYIHSDSTLVRRVTLLAFEQIAAPLLAGGLLTFTMYRTAPEAPLASSRSLVDLLFVGCICITSLVSSRDTVRGRLLPGGRCVFSYFGRPVERIFTVGHGRNIRCGAVAGRGGAVFQLGEKQWLNERAGVRRTARASSPMRVSTA